jgi:TetR/AcrR family transcriptional regulator, regulator of autoinduction and epiphytic fitness
MNPLKSPKQKVADKAEAILAGAMQEFMTCGYAAASMDRIAVAAGVSKPTLYSYFQGKEGLFTALIQQMTQSDQLLEEGRFLQLPIRNSLKQLAIAFLDRSSGEQPLLTFLRLIIGESGRFPDLAQTFVRNFEKPTLEKFSYLFAHHPDLNVADPEITARFFVGSMVHYVIVQEILHGRDILPLEPDRFVDGLIDLIVSERSSLIEKPRAEG